MEERRKIGEGRERWVGTQPIQNKAKKEQEKGNRWDMFAPNHGIHNTKNEM